MLDKAECTYSSEKTPMVVAGFAKESHKDFFIPNGLHEWDICRTILEGYSHPGQTMYEPFCGMGFQARIGIQLGLTVIGTEIIPNKFQKIIEKTKGVWRCQRN